MSQITSILSRTDWLQHVSTWRVSAMMQAAYRLEHKLNIAIFNGWVHRDRNTLSSTAKLTTCHSHRYFNRGTLIYHYLRA